MSKNNCGNCRFYDGRTSPGVCRRFPPTAVVGSSFGAWRQGYPDTSTIDWCGEHKTKPAEGEPTYKLGNVFIEPVPLRQRD